MVSLKTRLGLIGIMAVWGMNVSAVKVLTLSFHPLMMAALRMLLAAIVINMLLWHFKRSFSLPKLSARQWLRLLACAFLMVYMNQILLAKGLFTATAVNGALIMALAPLVATVFAAILFRETLSVMRLVGIAIGLMGVAAVVFSQHGFALAQAGAGDFAVMGSMFTFSLGGLLVQALARDMEPLVISGLIYILGAALLLAHALLSPSVVITWQTVFPNAMAWALIIFSGVIATGVGSIVWNHAISKLGAARTTIYQYWIPAFGVLIAVVVLGEALRFWHVFGLAAIFLGTYLGTHKATT